MNTVLHSDIIVHNLVLGSLDFIVNICINTPEGCCEELEKCDGMSRPTKEQSQ